MERDGNNHFIYLLIYLFCFLGLHLRDMEVPRLGVKSELHLHATATATRLYLRPIYYSSQQGCILNPLREAKDQTWVLMDTSQVCFHWATTGTPGNSYFSGWQQIFHENAYIQENPWWFSLAVKSKGFGAVLFKRRPGKKKKEATYLHKEWRQM